MLKKIFFFFFILCSLYAIENTEYIETERTLLIPWTIDHSREWEIIELQDNEPSYFCRNDYFESSDNLITRDRNWLAFVHYIHSLYGTTLLFPTLGFAVIDKKHHELIGTIRIKINREPGTIRFGYALKSQVRNCKLGQEIMKIFIPFLISFIGSPVLSFKEEKSKKAFIEAWRKEGIKENPNFEYLASFFSKHTRPLEKIVASIDISNPASLKILLSNGFQPFLIECSQYEFVEKSGFTIDMVLQYPQNGSTEFSFDHYINNLLSRDTHCINETVEQLREFFSVSSTKQYLHLSREEKSRLQPVSKIITSTSSLLFIDTCENYSIPKRCCLQCCFID